MVRKQKVISRFNANILEDFKICLSSKIDYNYDCVWHNVISLNKLKCENTSPLAIKQGYCLECGNYYEKKIYGKKVFMFCSYSCSSKYKHKKRFEAVLRFANKHVTELDVKNFIKKYQNFANNLMYSCDIQVHDDLFDWWNLNILKFVYYEKRRKMPLWMYFRKTIPLMGLLFLKKRQKEIGYDDCSYKTKMYILGECNDER